MNKVRRKAFKLRLQGFSYNEINRNLGISKSTLSSWFSDLVLSREAKARLDKRKCLGTEILIKRNKMQTHIARQRAKAIQQNAKKKIGSLSKREIMLIGAALYWGEGYKRMTIRNGREITSHTISFVNADAGMIQVFLGFLVNILNIPKSEIRLTMRLYQHINENWARKYWMSVTDMPKDRFFKTTYLISGASKQLKPYNRLPYGTLQVEVCSTNKFHHVMGLIEGMKEQF